VTKDTSQGPKYSDLHSLNYAGHETRQPCPTQHSTNELYLFVYVTPALILPWSTILFTAGWCIDNFTGAVKHDKTNKWPTQIANITCQCKIWMIYMSIQSWKKDQENEEKHLTSKAQFTPFCNTSCSYRVLNSVTILDFSTMDILGHSSDCVIHKKALKLWQNEEYWYPQISNKIPRVKYVQTILCILAANSIHCKYTFHHCLRCIMCNKLQTVLKCTFLWSKSTVCSAKDGHVANRGETHFNQHAWLEWDYGQLVITLQTLWQITK